MFKVALLQFFLFSGLLHAAGQGQDQIPPPSSNPAGVQDVVSLTDTDQSLYGNTIREIRITQLQHTDRDIITRELASQVGEPYLQENTQKDLERLDRLGIFSAIEIEPIREGDGVVLVIDVEETFPHLPIVSLEVSDENGVSVGPGFKSLNLAGRDISLSASARFGGSTNFEATVENPWFAGDHLSYRIEFFHRDRRNEMDDFDETATELDLRLGSYLGENGRIGGRLHFLSLGSDSPGITLSPDNRDNIAALGFFAGYDSRDFWTNPHRGWWNEIEVSKSGNLLGGDVDFWTFNFDVRRFQPLADQHILALFTLTTLQTGEVGETIPLHQDFHLGGSNSIRGWGLDSTKGKNQFINTIEYRYEWVPPRARKVFGFNFYLGVQLALFGDFGVAWNDRAQKNRWLDGYGLGIRFLVPFVDMIRVDFAFGEPGEGVGSHIGIQEKAVMQRRRVR